MVQTILSWFYTGPWQGDFPILICVLLKARSSGFPVNCLMVPMCPVCTAQCGDHCGDISGGSYIDKVRVKTAICKDVVTK